MTRKGAFLLAVLLLCALPLGCTQDSPSPIPTPEAEADAPVEPAPLGGPDSGGSADSPISGAVTVLAVEGAVPSQATVERILPAVNEALAAAGADARIDLRVVQNQEYWPQVWEAADSGGIDIFPVSDLSTFRSMAEHGVLADLAELYAQYPDLHASVPETATPRRLACPTASPAIWAHRPMPFIGRIRNGPST